MSLEEPMTYTYTWAEPDQTALYREDANGKIIWIPTDPNNISYATFLDSGATAAPYVAPAKAAPLTTEEKVNNLLSDYDLTRDELRAVLDN